MATEDIKVVNIPQQSLEKVDENNNYVFRFRLSNEDNSQKSSWSPYVRVAAKNISGTPIPSSQINVSKSDNIVSLQWTATQTSSRPLYDVFVRYGNSSDLSAVTYEFLDTVSATFATAVDPGDANHVQFRIQVAGLVQEVNDNLLLGQSTATGI
jgi:hypothetical protein